MRGAAASDTTDSNTTTKWRRAAAATAALTAITAAAAAGTATQARADTAQTLPTCTATAIQAALDAGGTWDMGVCATTPLPSNNATTFTLTSGIVTLEYNGASNTDVILNSTGNLANGKAGLFQVNGGHLTLDNMTLTGKNYVSDPSEPAEGGALYVAAGASATLTDDVVENSFAFGGTPTNGANGTNAGDNGANATDDGSAGYGGGVYNAGTLTITDTTFNADDAQGGDGASGGSGAGGANGPAGMGGTGGTGDPILENGGPGNNGTSGGRGGDAGDGAPAEGGAIYNVGNLTMTGGAITNSEVAGGSGGSGGNAANGGNGGKGGDAANGSIGTSTAPTGGQGGNGGLGGKGGGGGNHAGVPGDGGVAYGGAIYSSSDATIVGTRFDGDQAFGGLGGLGGNGSEGGTGGSGGAGGRGGDGYEIDDAGATAGNGGLGGSGGPVGEPGTGGVAAATGGDGGTAEGGAVYNTGTAAIGSSTFTGDIVSGGIGGAGGKAPLPNPGDPIGGSGGRGGNGGNSTNGTGGDAGDGGSGGPGSNGGGAFNPGNGGNGGGASGLSIYTATDTSIGCDTFDTDLTGIKAIGGGAGGNGGVGVAASAVGPAGQPGSVGTGGAGNGSAGVPGDPGNPGTGAGSSGQGSKGQSGTAGTKAFQGTSTDEPCPVSTFGGLTFGNAIGTSHEEQVTINNPAGSVADTFGPDTIIGDPGDTLAISNDNCVANSPIPAGGSCTLDVTFTPVNETEVDATLVLSDQSIAGHLDLPITATGAAPPPPTVDLSKATIGGAKTITAGGKVTLTATLTDTSANGPIRNAAITLLQRPAGAKTYTSARSATTSTLGIASATVKPTVDTSYEWSYAGTPQHHKTTSFPTTVSVRSLVGIHLQKSTVSHRKAAVVFGAITPGKAGETVIVTFRQAKKAARKAAKAARLALPGSKKKVLGYEVKAKLKPGKYAVIVELPSTVENRASHSKTVTLTVT